MRYIKYIIFICALFILPDKSGSILLDRHQERFHVDMELHKDSTRYSEIDQYFRNMVRTGFNGAMLVAHQGNVIYKKAHGLKSASTRDSLSLQSSFQLASISKQFTAAAIMKLKEMGVLDYSDKVARHIEGFPYKDITIRHLLTHRSGLMEYTYFIDQYVKDKSTYISNDDVLKKIIKLAPTPYYKADSRFNYRNTNYMLLASIVEHATGISFPQFLHTHFFAPLEMQHSFVLSKKSDLKRPYITKGHQYKWREYNPFFLDGVYGEKNVYASVEDLFKWDRALYTNKILKQATLKEAFKPGSPDHWGTKNYGFGWRMKPAFDGDTLYYHTGWWRGYKTIYVRIPETQSSIIILSNELYHSFMSSYPRLVKLLKQKQQPA